MLYKLTNSNDCTKGSTKWGPNVKHAAKRVRGRKRKLCSADLIHAYKDPLLAILMDPIQGKYTESGFHLWTAKGKVAATDGTKVGCVSLTTLERIEPPKVTREQRVRFAIYATQKVVGSEYPKWSKWAEKWLSGEDRSEGAARAAWAASYSACAYYAAHAASYSARAAYDAAAAWVAYDTAYAANAAAQLDKKLDLAALAHKAIEEESNGNQG